MDRHYIESIIDIHDYAKNQCTFTYLVVILENSAF